MMPIMDGLTLCERIKTNEHTKHISIILITSYSNSDTHVKRGLDAGADDFISRPISPKDLLARVRTVVRLKHAELAAQRDAIKTAQENRELIHINTLVEQEVAQRTRELLQEKTKLETILDDMADGVLVLNTQQQIQTINDTAVKILSIPTTDILGKSIHQCTFDNQLWQALQTIFSDNVSHKDSLFVQSVRPNKSIQSVRVHITQLLIDGEIEGWVILLSDISSIVEAEQMKVRFITGVTHELKTPLSIIQLHTNNMLKYSDRLTIEKQTTFLNGIKTQTKLLSKLIDDVLTLTKLGSNKDSTEEHGASLTAIIDETLTKISPLAADKKIEIVWIPHPINQTMLVNLEAKNLRLVIGNLLENALKYTLPNGTITITTQKIITKNQSSLQFSVTDTGIGISEADQPHIFNRFFRADSTHAIPGTGLGLAIVKEIVDAHHGDITITSELNKGSTFTVTLPLLDAK